MFLRAGEYYACLPGYVLSSRRPQGVIARPRGIGARAMSLASAAFGDKADGSGSLPVSGAARADALHHLPPPASYVGLAPGSREARKNWPLERYTAVANALVAQGHVPVFILGPFEQRWLDELRASVPQALFPDIDPIDRTLAVIARLSLVVANDSGMGHMTAALGVPLVSLFGPTEAERWRPFGGDVRVIRAQDFGRRAMDAIPVDAVLALVRERLTEIDAAKNVVA
jgi:ADP-heptose:LPS heptosyltransferase